VGLAVGLRAGFALPFAKVDGAPGDTLYRTTTGAIPLWLDGGWRFDPHWFAGIYASYAPGFVGGALRSACEPDCAAEVIRVGVQAHAHLFPDAIWDPWFGVGLGFE
jgi:hypothetical protein